MLQKTDFLLYYDQRVPPYSNHIIILSGHFYTDSFGFMDSFLATFLYNIG